MAAVTQIVSGIDGDVLADLNGLTAGEGALLGDRSKLDLGAVSLPRATGERSVVWTSTTEPETLSTRQVTVPVVAVGQDVAARITRINELVRRPFWLRVRRHAAATTAHLRCYPTVPTWQAPIVAGHAQGIAVGAITATTDPYAYGPRVDLPPAEVPQDASRAGAFVIDIGGVLGDSPTPLCLSSADPALLGEDHGLLIAVRRRGTPRALGSMTVQAETGQLAALGTSPPTMTAFTGDTDMCGSAGVSVTFSDAGGEASLGQVTIPASAWPSGTQAPGTYRVLVRARRMGASRGMEHNLRVTAGPLVADGLYTAGGGDSRVIDLGLVQVPSGQPGWHAAPHMSPGALFPDVTILVWKTSTGAGRLDLDWVALVPADEGLGVAYGAAGGVPVGTWWHLDGYDHTPRLFSGHPYGAATYAVGQQPWSELRFVGGMPMLGPGTNRLWVIGGLHTGSRGTSWGPAKVVNVQGSYWPRYGWLP